MPALRELELHLDHTDLGTAEVRELGQSLPTTLKRLCMDLRSCHKLKQDSGLKVERHLCGFQVEKANADAAIASP